MRFARPIFAVSLMALAGACADGARVVAPVATPGTPRAIINGTPTGTAYGNVGAIMYDFRGDGLDSNDWFCSGSLISPTVFLTAAHCLEFLPAGAQIYVTFAPSTSTVPLGAIAATAYHYDTAYTQVQSDPHDIGVVILPAKKTQGVTPAHLPPAGYLDALALNGGLKDQLFINVGYGGTGNYSGQPIITYDGVRRVSKSPFQNLENAWLLLNMNTNATGEGGDCYGDSGSPKFVDGDPTIVVATVITGDYVCRATSKDYRVDTPNARAFLSHYVTLP